MDKNMSSHTSKRWHFRLADLGPKRKALKIIRGGHEVCDTKKRPLGLLQDIGTPSTRKLCKQAETYLDYAIEVSTHAATDIM